MVFNVDAEEVLYTNIESLNNPDKSNTMTLRELENVVGLCLSAAKKLH